MTTGLRNRFAELNSQTVTESAIELANGDGSYNVTLDGLREVPGPEYAEATVTSNDGIVAKVEAVDPGGAGENVVQVVLYQGGGAGAPLDTVANAVGVADIAVTAHGK